MNIFFLPGNPPMSMIKECELSSYKILSYLILSYYIKKVKQDPNYIQKSIKHDLGRKSDQKHISYFSLGGILPKKDFNYKYPQFCQ